MSFSSGEILDILSEIRFSKYLAIFEAAKGGIILPPFKGSTFRGTFGHVFREVACTCPRNYKGEVEKHFLQCAYSYIFETPGFSESEVFKNYDSIPRPFLLEPTKDQSEYFAPGERFTLGFTLLGNGIEYLPHFVYVLEEMGKKGMGQDRHVAKLRQVFRVDINGDLANLIYHSTDPVLKEENKFLYGKDIISKGTLNSTKELEVHFITPTRIKYQGQYSSLPEFNIIFKAVVRRLSAILYFHHGQIKIDYDDLKDLFVLSNQIKLVSNDVKWIDWERYSSRQKERLKMGGIVGKATYQGELSPFIPWFKIAEWANIGKNSVFGLGKIKVIYD